ncbi:MAG: TIGR04283 family arsenosugar biosynthesis glycosyltransferase [Thermodesulfovibrionales bacterium]
MISVIIPALNEAANISTCIEAVCAEGGEIEIIVADGGSTDNTRPLASGYPGLKVVESKRGRGIQMNTGAFAASGDVFIFLHADTTLEKGWSQSIRETLEDGSFAGGAFTFSVDNPSSKYRLVEAWVQMRCALFGLPYGDQAIFIRKDIFRILGGYRDIPLMEDVDLIGRMKKIGRIAILDKKAFTSGRRWTENGLVKTASVNQITMLLYKLGVSPERLYRLYYR